MEDTKLKKRYNFIIGFLLMVILFSVLVFAYKGVKTDSYLKGMLYTQETGRIPFQAKDTNNNTIIQEITLEQFKANSINQYLQNCLQIRCDCADNGCQAYCMQCEIQGDVQDETSQG